MFKIVHKQILAEHIKRIDIAAPAIAAKVSPGQFVMITPRSEDHSIPMSVVDSDERKGSISLIVHECGEATRALGNLSIGEAVYKVLGPLGAPAQVDKFGLVVCVATGIGAAQILPLCRALKKKGNKVIGIVGAKSKKVLMLESQMRVVCDEIFITTNDGSYERKGLATGILKELLNKYSVNCVYAIGSVDMMEAAALMTKEKGIPIKVTLNPYMSTGLGLCGSCRVKVDGELRLACTDGPQFDGHKVDYKDLHVRMNASEEMVWGTNPLTSLKRPGFTTFVKSLWASKKR
jgi:ferredoxin--NADP+ reductase